MQEVWQTTNQQPWVEALAAGVITLKTRTSSPRVPVGATVLLHASKARLWPGYKGLTTLIEKLPEKRAEKWPRGVVSAIGIVKEVGWTMDLVDLKREINFWDVDEADGDCWSSIASFGIRFQKVKRLKVPIAVRGFQAPFCRAPQTTIDAILRFNPELESYFK